MMWTKKKIPFCETVATKGGCFSDISRVKNGLKVNYFFCIKIDQKKLLHFYGSKFREFHS